MKLKFIFEDEDIIIVDKSSGLTVNRSETTKGDTMQDWLEEKFKHSLRSDDLKIDVERSGIVHRLDKETSGILIVAKNTESFIDLQKQFKERKVKKTYVALVHGIVNSDGEVRVPIGRLPWNRKRFGVLAGGREAVTKFKVLKNNIKVNNEPLSLLELYPETGRTHQIRVHMKYLNHPVFADELYAGRKLARADREVLPRLFLHASHISFTHPKKGDMVEFKSDLPEELLKIIS